MEEKKIQKTDKDLHPERYDESLFRQAYKAGLELKKLKEKDSRRKLIVQIALGLFLMICATVGIWYIRNIEPLPYISPVQWDIQKQYQVQQPEIIHLFKEFNVGILAESAVAFNPDSGEILYEKDISTKRQIASLTKMMTAIIAIENMELEEVVEVSQIPMYGEDGAWAIELEKGDQVTVENLLKMMLMSSYNDAASILAEHLGAEEFISLMNKKAETLGLEDTHFSNPCGFDNENNYSTVDDLRKLVKVFLQYPFLVDTVGTLIDKVEYVRGGEVVTKTVYTTNSLLDGVKVKGIKTGYTEDAGRCLVTLFEYEDGERIVTILLNSDERYGDTEKIEETFINLKYPQ